MRRSSPLNVKALYIWVVGCGSVVSRQVWRIEDISRAWSFVFDQLKYQLGALGDRRPPPRQLIPQKFLQYCLYGKNCVKNSWIRIRISSEIEWLLIAGHLTHQKKKIIIIRGQLLELLLVKFVQLPLSRTGKYSCKNSWIRSVIRITTKFRSSVTSHTWNPSKNFHNNSLTNFELPCWQRQQQRQKHKLLGGDVYTHYSRDHFLLRWSLNYNFRLKITSLVFSNSCLALAIRNYVT